MELKDAKYMLQIDEEWIGVRITEGLKHVKRNMASKVNTERPTNRL